MATKGTTLLEMTAFRIKESETTLTKDYAVQGQVLLGWLTIGSSQQVRLPRRNFGGRRLALKIF